MILWSWIIAQLLMVLYIRFSSLHHAPAVNAMRNHVPQPNIYEDEFHFWSIFQAIVVALAISLGLLAYHNIWWCAANGFICAAWYWALFDPWLNKETGKDWDYIGEEAGTDRFLTKMFKDRAGEYKLVLCLLFIAIINAIRFYVL